MKILSNRAGYFKLILLILPLALLALGVIVQRKKPLAQDPVGLSISPVKMDDPNGNVIQLLDIKLWNFKVKTKTNQRFNGRLELRENGKLPQILGTIERSQFPSNGETEAEVSVGIYPIGDDLSRADKIKWQIVTPGVTQSNTISNPFKNAIIFGFSKPQAAGDYPPVAHANETYLMDVDFQHPPELRHKLGWAVRKARLFLVLKVEPQAKE